MYLAGIAVSELWGDDMSDWRSTPDAPIPRWPCRAPSRSLRSLWPVFNSSSTLPNWLLGRASRWDLTDDDITTMLQHMGNKGVLTWLNRWEIPLTFHALDIYGQEITAHTVDPGKTAVVRAPVRPSSSPTHVNRPYRSRILALHSACFFDR